jgi:hypothetical protein
MHLSNFSLPPYQVLAVVISGVLSLYLPWYDYPFLRYGLSGDDLLQTSGLIVRSNIVSSSGRNDTIYSLDMQYDYVVNEKKYSGYQIELDSTFSKSHVYLLNSRFKSGNVVTVYYDAKNPEYSLLTRGIKFGHLGIRSIMSAIIFFLFSFFFMVTFPKLSKLF